MKNKKYALILTFLMLFSIEIFSFLSFTFIQDSNLDLAEKRLLSTTNEIPGSWDFEEAHPYFGFQLSQKWMKKYKADGINNYSFRSKHDFPYIKKGKNEFVIGVFGGSVAQFFLVDMLKGKHFETKLKERFPYLKNKKIILLNMAMGGSKQPQQYFINSYFVKMYDFVINIDGYNEIEANVPENRPVEYPYYSEILYNQNIKRESLLGEVSIHKKSLMSLNSYALNKSFFYTSKLILHLLRKNKLNDIIEVNNEFQKISKRSSKKFYGKEINLNELIVKRVEAWSRFSLLQSQILKANKIAHLFFLQPSLSFEKKTLSDNEKEIYNNKTNNYFKEIVDIGYPMLKNEISKLKLENVPYISLTDLFAGTSKSIYLDYVHLNKVGHKLMSDKIIESMNRYCKKDFSNCSLK